MFHFNSLRISNNIDDDIIITVEEDYTSTSSINEKLGFIPAFIGVATYSLVSGLPNINWQSESYNLWLTVNEVEFELKTLSQKNGTLVITTPGTYTAGVGDAYFELNVTGSATTIVVDDFSAGHYFWITNNKESYLPPITLSYSSGQYTYVITNGKTIQFFVLQDYDAELEDNNDYIFAFNYTEINVEDSDFVCHQPDFLNGIYNGSNYVLIDATELPNGLKIYLNTGEFGFVKDAKCLIKLDSPLETGNVIYCFVDTNNCNVQSCEYVVGEYVSGEVGCIDASGILPEGTLTGAFICLDTDLHKEVFNEYGQKVAGIVVQENCYLCGGTEPSCV